MLAAGATPPGAHDSLIAAIGGVVVALLGALGLVTAEVMRGRNSHTTSSPPEPHPEKDVELYERTAVLGSRADDADQRDDLQDRALHNHGDRLEALEQWADRHDPRRRPGG